MAHTDRTARTARTDHTDRTARTARTVSGEQPHGGFRVEPLFFEGPRIATLKLRPLL